MKPLRMYMSLAVIFLFAAALGCSGSSEESTVEAAVDEAAAEMQETAESVSENAASMVDEIKEELAAKQAELDEINEQIKELSPEELMSEAGKDLQAKAQALMQEIEALKKKL